MSQPILNVALPVPRGDTYDYYPPTGFAGKPPLGARVQVPFGRRRLVGVIVGVSDTSAVPAAKLRPASRVLDDAPLLDATTLELLRFASRYYQFALGATVAAALPVTLRNGQQAEIRTVPRWQLTAAGRDLDLDELTRAPRQVRVLNRLRAAEAPLEAVAFEDVDGASTVLRTLEQRGWVEQAGAESAAGDIAVAGPVLTAEQQAAVDAVLGSEGFVTHLLDGVTGSGKTAVYLAAAEQLCRQGRQVLVLVPEIGLTPQTVDRFRQRIPGEVAVLHSGLADTDRQNAWLRARSGEAQVVLGTRSAVFVPLRAPGLIIVDEEHDTSFKQQDSLHYHARDLAVRRGQLHGIPVLLGSATPALETLHNAARGRYQRHHLSQRIGATPLPKIRLVDVRQQRLQDGLSPPLIAAVSRELEAGGQVFLFLNRRGFAPVLLCHACGWIAACTRCDARLVVHSRAHQLRCHHCDHRQPIPPACPSCEATSFVHVGQGTERIETAVQALWPDVPAVRIDRDSTRRKGALENALRKVDSGEARLIIGTQMLAKGHDFPDLSLVCVLDADQGLFGIDFRAPEYLAQLVTQVAGRAGRREQQGQVLIQTHNPEHPVLQALVHGSYAECIEWLRREREQGGWPPYAHLALVRTESSNAQAGAQLLSDLRDAFAGVAEVELMGPVPASIERKAGRYRQQLLLRSADRRQLQRLLTRARHWLIQADAARRTRWSIDVDPVSLD